MPSRRGKGNSTLKVRPHRKGAAAAGRPSREIAAVCYLVTPDGARQLRAVQCEEKPSSLGYKVVSICRRLGYFSLIHDVQFRWGRTTSVSTELQKKKETVVDARNQWEEGTLGLQLFDTRFLYSGWPVPYNEFFSEFFRHSVLHAWQICLQNTNVRCPPRQPAFCLTGMMQSYIIQFERLPAAGTDRCPPRQLALCVAESLTLPTNFARNTVSVAETASTMLT